MKNRGRSFGWLLRLGALAGLWALSRTDLGKSPYAQRVSALSWPAKVRLAWGLLRDSRVPLWARGIMLLPALYVASPLDLLPDFIPVLGQLDDGLVFAVASNLMLRLGVPESIIEDHIVRIETGG